MKVTMLRDKLNIGIRFRLDDVSISDLVAIEHLIKGNIEYRKKFIKEVLSENTDEDIQMRKSQNEEIEKSKSMLDAMENYKVTKLNCYHDDVEEESFETILKKYKRFKEVIA